MRSFFALALLAVSGVALATPLTMDYTVTDLGGGIYDYEIWLTLDNHDNSWSAGQGFGWLIFGDQNGAPSPLTDWSGDPGDLPVGPWTGYTTSSGGHNGPTFNFVLDTWNPTSVGDSLHWTGTSTANLGQGEMLWSTIFNTGGAVGGNFEVANLLPVPEPTTVAVLGLGALALLRRRAKK